MTNIKQGRRLYSTPQIHAYMQRIDFPATEYGDPSSFRPNLANLKLLIRLHLLAFPFENSRLHYAATHEMDVSPEHIYNRLVETRQGGSWCCGQNGLLLGMLRGLGYRAYSAPGRVNESPQKEEATDWTFLTHLVLFVQLHGESLDTGGESVVDAEVSRRETYLVDVGFGGNGPVRPILLEAGQTVPGSAPPEEHRLMRGMHPESSLEEDESSQGWVLQYRCGSHQPDWTILYLFTENESFPSDWIAYCQWLCRHPAEIFKNNVICIQHFVAGAEGSKGKEASLGRLIMMGNRVQRRIGDLSETVKEFSTEKERIWILKEDFGVTVDEDEIQNIVGTAPACSA